MADGQPHFIALRAVSAWLALGLLTACAGRPVTEIDIPPLENQPKVIVNDVNMLGVSPEMRQFVEAYAAPKSSTRQRAFSLVYATLDPYLLDFDYNPGITLTAEDAFHSRTGNCLTFSSMFIAMAREAGLNAWYQEVKVPPRWNAVNETMLVSMHVNAVVRARGMEYVVDVSRRKKELNEDKRRISDQEAKAQYYNNIGADALVGNQLAKAYANFRQGLATRPGLAYIWSNLGVVFRRNGQIGDAKQTYQMALDLDPHNTVALNNLYLIYKEEGNIAEAESMKARVEKNRKRNPYYLHHLAEVANDEERYADAIDLLKRAIRLENREYLFHYTLAQIQFLMGEHEVAQISLDRARQLAPSGPGEPALTLPDSSL
jgi:tetratricopeptide (TPR) repeat protein